MAELADAQRSGRCLVYPSTGSTPASGIRLIDSTGLLSDNVPQLAPESDFRCLKPFFVIGLGHLFSLHVSLRTTNGKNAII